MGGPIWSGSDLPAAGWACIEGATEPSSNSKSDRSEMICKDFMTISPSLWAGQSLVDRSCPAECVSLFFTWGRRHGKSATAGAMEARISTTEPVATTSLAVDS
ncbi:MAG: hypothetical protein MAG451_02000 [Anaerolineales bacterium]|nr:hypothetical protein [Anaerolineales bacterium]